MATTKKKSVNVESLPDDDLSQLEEKIKQEKEKRAGQKHESLAVENAELLLKFIEHTGSDCNDENMKRAIVVNRSPGCNRCLLLSAVKEGKFPEPLKHFRVSVVLRF